MIVSSCMHDKRWTPHKIELYQNDWYKKNESQVYCLDAGTIPISICIACMNTRNTAYHVCVCMPMLFVLWPPSGSLGQPHPNPNPRIIHVRSIRLNWFRPDWPPPLCPSVQLALFFVLSITKRLTHPWKKSPRRERFTEDLLLTVDAHARLSGF